MYAFYFSAVLKLLLFSAIAALVILLLWKVGRVFAGGVNDSKSDSGDELGCGCLVFIALGVLGGLLSYTGDKYEAIVTPYLSDSSSQAMQANRENGPLSLFKKEYGLLYSHYEKLQVEVRRNNQLRDSLQYELKGISSQRGRKKINERIKELQRANKIHKSMISDIEDKAGKYYFARMMDNLGLRVNQDELNAEIGNLSITVGNNE